MVVFGDNLFLHASSSQILSYVHKKSLEEIGEKLKNLSSETAVAYIIIYSSTGTKGHAFMMMKAPTEQGFVIVEPTWGADYFEQGIHDTPKLIQKYKNIFKNPNGYRAVIFTKD